MPPAPAPTTPSSATEPGFADGGGSGSCRHASGQLQPLPAAQPPSRPAPAIQGAAGAPQASLAPQAAAGSGSVLAPRLAKARALAAPPADAASWLRWRSCRTTSEPRWRAGAPGPRTGAATSLRAWWRCCWRRWTRRLWGWRCVAVGSPHQQPALSSSTRHAHQGPDPAPLAMHTFCTLSCPLTQVCSPLKDRTQRVQLGPAQLPAGGVDRRLNQRMHEEVWGTAAAGALSAASPLPALHPRSAPLARGPQAPVPRDGGAHPPRLNSGGRAGGASLGRPAPVQLHILARPLLAPVSCILPSTEPQAAACRECECPRQRLNIVAWAGPLPDSEAPPLPSSRLRRAACGASINLQRTLALLCIIQACTTGHSARGLSDRRTAVAPILLSVAITGTL